MKFTVEDLKKLNPCKDGLNWYCENIKSEVPREILMQINNYRYDWARWLMVRLLSKEQNQKLSIFAAELVLDIYEKKYPKDFRVRECIEASKKYLDGKINIEELKEKRSAADAAYATDAAYAATYAADAAAAAAAAACATDAACAAAYATAAAAAAADAADAADAAYAAANDAAARKIIQEKIINYACDLLEATNERDN